MNSTWAPPLYQNFDLSSPKFEKKKKKKKKKKERKKKKKKKKKKKIELMKK